MGDVDDDDEGCSERGTHPRASAQPIASYNAAPIASRSVAPVTRENVYKDRQRAKLSLVLPPSVKAMQEVTVPIEKVVAKEEIKKEVKKDIETERGSSSSGIGTISDPHHPSHNHHHHHHHPDRPHHHHNHHHHRHHHDNSIDGGNNIDQSKIQHEINLQRDNEFLIVIADTTAGRVASSGNCEISNHAKTNAKRSYSRFYNKHTYDSGVSQVASCKQRNFSSGNGATAYIDAGTDHNKQQQQKQLCHNNNSSSSNPTNGPSKALQPHVATKPTQARPTNRGYVVHSNGRSFNEVFNSPRPDLNQIIAAREGGELDIDNANKRAWIVEVIQKQRQKQQEQQQQKQHNQTGNAKESINAKENAIIGLRAVYQHNQVHGKGESSLFADTSSLYKDDNDSVIVSAKPVVNIFDGLLQYSGDDYEVANKNNNEIVKNVKTDTNGADNDDCVMDVRLTHGNDKNSGGGVGGNVNLNYEISQNKQLRVDIKRSGRNDTAPSSQSYNSINNHSQNSNNSNNSINSNNSGRPKVTHLSNNSSGIYYLSSGFNISAPVDSISTTDKDKINSTPREESLPFNIKDHLLGEILYFGLEAEEGNGNDRNSSNSLTKHDANIYENNYNTIINDSGIGEYKENNKSGTNFYGNMHREPSAASNGTTVDYYDEDEFEDDEG